jgi:formate acetyltransferase 1
MIQLSTSPPGRHTGKKIVKQTSPKKRSTTMNAPETNLQLDAWRGFAAGEWQSKVAVRDFIQKNYTEYTGDDSFLAAPTARTLKLWEDLSVKLKEERACPGGVLDVALDRGTGINVFAPGYIDKDLETIVGVQTDAPLKRAIFPNTGLRMVEQSLEEIGRTLDPKIAEIYGRYRKDHNSAVFDAYNPLIRACRSSGVITGLPDAYGRGRIIGDYRRVALYGLDFLVRTRSARSTNSPRRHQRRRSACAKNCPSRSARSANCGRWPSYGFDISARRQRARSGAMDLLRLPRRRQGTERRRHVDRPHLHLPRHLHRARHQGRPCSPKAKRRS